MLRLMDVIGYTLKAYIEQSIKGITPTNMMDNTTTFWSTPYGAVQEYLRAGVEICSRWAAVVQSLTTQFWPSCSGHPWKTVAGGEAVEAAAYALRLRARLSEVDNGEMRASFCAHSSRHGYHHTPISASHDSHGESSNATVADCR